MKKAAHRLGYYRAALQDSLAKKDERNSQTYEKVIQVLCEVIEAGRL